MTAKIKELKEQALLLTPEEREILAQEILHSLADESLTDIDKVWINEAEKRYTLYKKGKRMTIPYKKVLEKIRKEIE